MNYYIQVKDNEIVGKSNAKILNEEILNIIVSKYVYDNIERYVYQDGILIIDDGYEEKQKLEERARLDALSLARGDVFEAFILAKNLTKPQIRVMIEEYEGLTDTEKLLYLNRFDEALNFYRGYPIFNLLGAKLNISEEMLDEYFILGNNSDTKDVAWKALIKYENTSV